MSHAVSRLTVSVLAAAALAGGLAACGDDDTPTASTAATTAPPANAASAATPSTPTVRNTVDAAYVRQMMPHNAAVAVVAGQAPKEAKNAAIKKLAKAAQAAQSKELRALHALAAKRGYDLNQADAAQEADAKLLGLTVEELGTPINVSQFSRDFDRAFVDLMILHHEGSLKMSRAVREHGSDASLKRLANARTRELKQELRQLQALPHS